MTDTTFHKAFLHGLTPEGYKRIRTPTIWGLAVDARSNLCSGCN